ncbi:CPBP family intramembrane glutamic endopeptidase [Auraticoccus monumenti]|uniref:Membrane protease YdiL, CAAX protease family n=1 Tax=Auraticoccus monumenti TaxID=675864 RepID=A0A1G7AKI0_9ACTN|nr:type II CAAX endopeptidase family protein [Auraticoccus monumenti]SDE15230.1 Membrane protease YdiL, CAAX protease family [Auraticoccus monumenti]
MTVQHPAGAPVRPHRGAAGGRHRDLVAVVVFVALAFALGWLVALPLWLGDGLTSPWFPVVAVALMTTPTIAALAVVLLVERPQRKAETLGLWPLTPLRRVLGYGALGVFVPIALVLVALPVGALLGVYPADFVGLSAFRQLLDAQAGAAGVGELPLSVGAIVALQLATLPLAAVLNLIPALGEEIGWRGWLLPKLMPLGTVPALLVSGVVWGLWHAPVILLGYNYPDAPGWLGLTMMVGTCTVFGAVFGWLRLRSGSVWPAALAHAAFNGAAGTYLLFARAGERVDTTQATVLGWSGWIVPLVLVAVLLATGRLAPAAEPSGPARGASVPVAEPSGSAAEPSGPAAEPSNPAPVEPRQD